MKAKPCIKGLFGVVMAIVGLNAFSGSAAAQSPPTFTFTSASGSTMKGYFIDGSALSIRLLDIIAEDGTVNTVSIEKIQSMTLTVRKPPFDTNCLTLSKVVVTMMDASRREGCVGYSVSFISSHEHIVVGTLVGKFSR